MNRIALAVVTSLAAAAGASAQNLITTSYKMPNNALGFTRHVDTEKGIDWNRVPGLVENTLGPNGLPRVSAFGQTYSGPSGPIADFNVATNEILWWTPGTRAANRVVLSDGPANQLYTPIYTGTGVNGGPSTFIKEFNFFPDGELGNENFFRTSRWSGSFQLTAGQIPLVQMAAYSDDDAWVFINGQLALDQGGIKPFGAAPAPFVNSMLVAGTNTIEIFFADRHTVQANFRLETNIYIVPAPASAGVLALGGLLAARRRRA